MKFVCPSCGLKQDAPHHESFRACRSCLKNLHAIQSPVEVRWIDINKGRGVFATDGIPQGCVLERCHAILLSELEGKSFGGSFPTLARYVFPWKPGKCFLTGNGLLYNHNSAATTGRDPNMRAVIQLGSLTVDFVAARDIHRGEELTYDYRGILFGDSST